jgi:hypothetical protein
VVVVAESDAQPRPAAVELQVAASPALRPGPESEVPPAPVAVREVATVSGRRAEPQERRLAVEAVARWLPVAPILVSRRRSEAAVPRVPERERMFAAAFRQAAMQPPDPPAHPAQAEAAGR